MVFVKNIFIRFSDESFRKCTICPRVQPVSAVKEDHIQIHVFCVRTQSLSQVGATLNLGSARSWGVEAHFIGNMEDVAAHFIEVLNESRQYQIVNRLPSFSLP